MKTYNPSEVFDKLNEMIENSPLPKVVDVDIWDESRRGYKKLTHRSILSNGEHALLDYLEQHYTLTKKQ